jgi:hypothetical protein
VRGLLFALIWPQINDGGKHRHVSNIEHVVIGGGERRKFSLPLITAQGE